MFGAQRALHITSLPRPKLSVSHGKIDFATFFLGARIYQQKDNNYRNQRLFVTSGRKGELQVDWNQIFEVLWPPLFVGQGRNLIGEIDVPKMTGMFTG